MTAFLRAVLRQVQSRHGMPVDKQEALLEAIKGAKTVQEIVAESGA